MALDLNTAKWKATITVELTPTNRYGDELADPGHFEFTKVLHVTSLTDLAAILDNIK
jgi:hypothetical protein